MPSLLGISQASYLNPSLYIDDIYDTISVAVNGMDASSMKQICKVVPWNISAHGNFGDVSVSVLGKNTYVSCDSSDENSLNFKGVHSGCVSDSKNLLKTVINIDEQARRVMFRRLETIDAKKNLLWGCPLPEVVKVDVLDTDGYKVPLWRGGVGTPSVVRLTEKDKHVLRLRNKYDESVSIAAVHWSKKDKDVVLCKFDEEKPIFNLKAGEKIEVPFDLQNMQSEEEAIHYLMLIVGETGAFNVNWIKKFVERLQFGEMENVQLPKLPFTKKWGLMTSPIKLVDFVGQKDYGMEELD